MQGNGRQLSAYLLPFGIYLFLITNGGLSSISKIQFIMAVRFKTADSPDASGFLL